jgi:hypothetical protein
MMYFYSFLKDYGTVEFDIILKKTFHKYHPFPAADLGI